MLLKANGGLDPEPLWRPWIVDGLEVHVSPGSHLDMMEEPWVEHTARIVRDALARAAAPPASTVLAGYAPGALQERQSRQSAFMAPSSANPALGMCMA